MSPDAQWAKLLPPNAYGNLPATRKAPPDPPIKARPYRGSIPYYLSARFITMHSAYRGPQPRVRLAMLKPERIYAGKISSNAILKCVMGVFKIDAVSLISPRRNMSLVVPRQAAYALLKEFTPMSYPMIGMKLGGRDHTTIMHGISRAQHLYTNDPDFAAKYDECRAILKAGMTVAE